MNTTSKKAIAAGFAAALLVAGCSSSDDGGNDTSSQTTGSTEASSPTTGGSVEETTTTLSAPEGPAPIEVSDIPDLVAAWADASGDPLELAQSIIGFPVAVPVPDGSTAFRISVDGRGTGEGEPWQWDWEYSAYAPNPISEINIDAEDMGPGAVALRDEYDPIMEALGWSYSNSTGSDPSSGAGGAQSVNHVYVSDEEVLTINGVEATALPLFVWADEELQFEEEGSGYKLGATFEIEPGAVPVPLAQTIFDALPAVDGAELISVNIDSFERTEDSFNAELGLRYFTVVLEFALDPGSETDAKTAFSTGLEAPLRAGSESFFDEGVFEAEDPTDSSIGWSQSIVFGDRYAGTITIETGDDASTATVSIDFDPNRPVLEDPVD